MNAAEADRRTNLEQQLFRYVLTHPRVWLSARDLRPVAGDAWRSRITMVRRWLDAMDYEFVWNRKNGGQSAYMLRDKPLGRDAGMPVTQKALF